MANGTTKTAEKAASNTFTIHNLSITTNGKKLRVDIDLDDRFSYETQKSVVIASSHGNVPIPGTDLRLGLNLYRPKVK
jgi:hypothetical protein